MRMFLRVPQFVWILGILLAISPRVGYGEESQSKLQQDVEKMKQSVEALKKSQQAAKEAEETSEKAKPLAAKTTDLFKQKNYGEAKKALEDWEKVDPKDFRISITRDFIAKIEAEADPAKKDILRAQYSISLLDAATQAVDEVNSSLDRLNEKLTELEAKKSAKELQTTGKK